jgi:hypothetical protein
MSELRANGGKQPVLTEIIDELIEFTDTAVPGPAEPAPAKPSIPPPCVLADEVDELMEFTDTAGTVAAEVNGAAQGSGRPQTNPAV